MNTVSGQSPDGGPDLGSTAGTVELMRQNFAAGGNSVLLVERSSYIRSATVTAGDHDSGHSSGAAAGSLPGSSHLASNHPGS